MGEEEKTGNNEPPGQKIGGERPLRQLAGGNEEPDRKPFAGLPGAGQRAVKTADLTAAHGVPQQEVSHFLGNGEPLLIHRGTAAQGHVPAPFMQIQAPGGSLRQGGGEDRLDAAALQNREQGNRNPGGGQFLIGRLRRILAAGIPAIIR